MLAAIALTWATALTAAPATAAAHAGRASAESYVPPTVRYLWAGSNTFDFSLDDGATVQSGYYQSVSPPPWAAAMGPGQRN